MGKLFGTDGIRGRAGQFPLDRRTVQIIGHAIGAHLGGPILLAEDPRESSPWIRQTLQKGMEAAGVETEIAGVVPTPGLALLTRESGSAGGVMISASHNAFQDNGIKVFKADGRKLEDAEEARIEEAVADATPKTGSDTVAEVPTAEPDAAASEWGERYLDLLRSRFDGGEWLSGLSILVDCANGATSVLAPSLLTSLGARVTSIHSSPSGSNINAGCGAVHPESLVDAVRKNGFDLGVAYDGDGDRSTFVSPSGRLIDGDAVILVMSRFLARTRGMEPAIVVGTSMTNYNLQKKLASEGIDLVRVDVGDRYVFLKMLETGAPMGGEPSGHIIFRDFGLSGDGLLTTLKLCRALRDADASLDEATGDWEPAPQIIENVPVAEKVPLEALEGVNGEIRQIEAQLDGRGRIVVRYSGTEPLLRIMIESDSDDLNAACAARLASRVREAMGMRLEVS